ncbi:MAG: translation initiation factor IF-3 [Terriglobia bacterium]
MAAKGREELRIADRFIRINERIRAKEIRVIDDEGKQLGVMPPWEALKLARERGLDLVEVAPGANPPVCRIINYGKYLYQLNKRQHDARKNQHAIELKEVKFRPRTGQHDFDVKKNHIIKFLQEGSKVKATIAFRGREMAHRNIGWEMMQRLVEGLAEHGQVETRPKQEGPNLTAIIAPKKTGGKTSPAAGGSQPQAQPSPVAQRVAAPTQRSGG